MKQLTGSSGNSQAEAKEYLADLIIPPASGEPDLNGVRECDLLAADSHDANKLGSGFDFESSDIDPKYFDRAVDACIAAVENNPQDYRQSFQLGRLLWYAGDQEAANEYINIASAGGYAPATYYKAEIFLGTSSEPDAFIDALDMFEASGNGGYARGSAMVKELNPDGIEFYKEIPPPTGSELMGALRVKGLSTPSLMGVSVSTRVSSVRVKSCFQISATDFSCEYVKRSTCSANGANSGGIAMLLGMMCGVSSGDLAFSTFRRLEEGKWTELASEY